jgi:hypothetical protein
MCSLNSSLFISLDVDCTIEADLIPYLKLACKNSTSWGTAVKKRIFFHTCDPHCCYAQRQNNLSAFLFEQDLSKFVSEWFFSEPI